MKYILFIFIIMSYNRQTVHSIEFDTVDACLEAKKELKTELTDHYYQSPTTLFMRCLKKGD